MNAVSLLDVQVANAEQTVPAVIDATPVVTVPYSRLCKSPLNVRRKPPTGIPAMAESIAAKGILQNLIVHEVKGGRGKEPKLGVAAGQRRHGGLDLLHATRRIPADFPVPVKIVSEGEARAVSLIENQEREPMHPADQCEAFSQLVAEGRSVEYVAALFSISERAVNRCLRLANVSPKLLDVFRADEMTYEQIVALALTDDRALQERLWFEASGPGQRTPHNLRKAITQTEIDASSSPLVAFVTLAGYEAAGGYVRRDLFSADERGGYVADPELLRSLALEKLLTISQGISAEGWAWVETRTQRDYEEMRGYARLSAQERDLTRKEATEYGRLQKSRDAALCALDAFYDAPESDEDDLQCDKLQDVVRETEGAVSAFEATMKTWTDEQKARAGVFVTLDHAGQVKIERGLVKPQDKAAAKRDGIPGTAEIHVIERQPKPLHGERLCARLTAHRTAAVQAEVMRRPTVALAIMMQTIIPAIFEDKYRLYGESLSASEVRAKCSHDAMLSAADDIEASAAWKDIQAERAKWAEQLPAKVSQLLPWLLAQSGDTLPRLFAFCVSATIDGISRADSAHPINALSEVVELDMTRYWKPTRSSYLDHVSKQRIMDVVSGAVSPEAAAPLATMKKAEAAEAAELRLAGEGWLPEVLTNRAVPKVFEWDDEEEEAGRAAA